MQHDPEPSPGVPTTVRPAPARRGLVLLMIAFTALFVIAVVSVLFYRGVTLREPRFILVVVGSPAWTGAEVSVSGMDLREPYVRTLSRDHGMKLPFYLDRGTYVLNIERDGHTILNTEVLLASGAGVQVDLRKYEYLLDNLPATQSSTAPVSPGDEPIGD